MSSLWSPLYIAATVRALVRDGLAALQTKLAILDQSIFGATERIDAFTGRLAWVEEQARDADESIEGIREDLLGHDKVLNNHDSRLKAHDNNMYLAGEEQTAISDQVDELIRVVRTLRVDVGLTDDIVTDLQEDHVSRADFHTLRSQLEELQRSHDHLSRLLESRLDDLAHADRSALASHRSAR